MDKPKNMDRRSFLKHLGIGAAATVTALAGCKNNSNTGALKRHPRDSYYIATKMSNHRLVGQGSSPQELYDESVKMYRNSFRDLQTDYIDYYLLHIVGIGEGLPTLMERFFDNNLLEFLLKEREAGRIRNLGFSYHCDIKAFDYLLSRHDEFHWDFVQIQLNYVDYRHAPAQMQRIDNFVEQLKQNKA